MLVSENFNLKKYNTLGIDATTRWFAAFESEEELLVLLDKPEIREKFHVLGEGSNVLFCNAFDGAILHNRIPGFAATSEGSNVFLTLGGGYKWHSAVERSVASNYYGIENLALIPGSAGAAPVQNIGAYGVEIKDVLSSVRGFNLKTAKFETLSNADCRLGYRDSIFKTELRGCFVITQITLLLSTEKKIRADYSALQNYFEKVGTLPQSALDIFDAVCAIRRSKLPDPREIGNAGSFFKNPVLSREQAEVLLNQFADLPNYAVDSTHVKIPAAYLIERAGFKGAVREKNGRRVGVHARQALVLVNTLNATGEMVLELAEEIRAKVHELFGVLLEMEVSVVGY